MHSFKLWVLKKLKIVSKFFFYRFIYRLLLLKNNGLWIFIFNIKIKSSFFSCEIYIYNTQNLCVWVWPPFFSAPSHDRNSRPVSLEPVWPEECPSKNNFPEKRPVAKSPTEKNVPPMLFYGKNFAQFVFMFETQSYWESKVPNAGVTWI